MNKEDKMKTVPKFDSRCEICRWYLGNKRCPAFDREIPEEVWKSEHDKAVEGQEEDDILYEPKGDIL